MQHMYMCIIYVYYIFMCILPGFCFVLFFVRENPGIWKATDSGNIGIGENKYIWRMLNKSSKRQNETMVHLKQKKKCYKNT